MSFSAVSSESESHGSFALCSRPDITAQADTA